MDTFEEKTNPEEETVIRAAMEKWVNERRDAPPAGERLKRIRASLARRKSPRRPAARAGGPGGWWLHTAAAALLIAAAGIAFWKPWTGSVVPRPTSDPAVEKVSTEGGDGLSPWHGHFRLLWQELKDTVLNPDPRRASRRISSDDTQPATAKELEPVRDLFTPDATLTKKSGETVKYYAYPFTGIEKAHKVLHPAVIPALLKGGRPTQLDPIPAMDGKELEPEKLLAFLENARVTKIQKMATPETAAAATMQLSDGNFRFMIPIQQINLPNGDNAWRLGQCELVKAIINRIAVKRKPSGEGDGLAP